jgi:hypothetical protein
VSGCRPDGDAVVEALILADATLWWLVSPGVRTEAAHGEDGCLTVTFGDDLYGDGPAEVVGIAVPSGEDWYLGCFGCRARINGTDAGLCPSCRTRLEGSR